MGTTAITRTKLSATDAGVVVLGNNPLDAANAFVAATATMEFENPIGKNQILLVDNNDASISTLAFTVTPLTNNGQTYSASALSRVATAGKLSMLAPFPAYLNAGTPPKVTFTVSNLTTVFVAVITTEQA